MKINVTKSSMPSFDEYVDEIKDLWESRWLSNRGVKHKKFEKELENYLSTNNVSLFANGHVALEVMLDAYHFPCGSEVITTPYTHCSTTHSIVRSGLVPIFCDVKEDDFTIDPDKIETLITKKTVAIMATHVYGWLCDVKRIEEIAKKHNLYVFYDGAHAFGVTLNGVGVANFGDACMFSCHATKVFHTIEGGIVRFKEDKIFADINCLTNFGFIGPEEVKFVSTNARMNEFEAAMGICNLRHINEEISKRKAVVERYRFRLGNIKGIYLPKPQKGVKENYSYFPVFFYDYKYTRDQIKELLEKENIFPRKYFYPLVTKLMCYKEQYGNINTPIASKAADCVLTLPLYADLSLEDVDNICDIILK